MIEQKKYHDKTILILFTSSFGEVDWILPICYYIKENHPEINLVALFDALDYNSIMRGNKLLYGFLREGVHECYDFKDFMYGVETWLYNLVENNIYNNKRFVRFKPHIKRYLFGLMRMVCCDRIVKSICPDLLLKDVMEDKDIRGRIISLLQKRGCKEVMFPHASEFYYQYEGITNSGKVECINNSM